MAAVAARKSPVCMSRMASRIVPFNVSFISLRFLSDNSIGEHGLHGRARLKCAEHLYAFDAGVRHLRSDVGGNTHQTQALDAQFSARFENRFQVSPRKFLQTEHQHVS